MAIAMGLLSGPQVTYTESTRAFLYSYFGRGAHATAPTLQPLFPGNVRESQRQTLFGLLPVEMIRHIISFAPSAKGFASLKKSCKLLHEAARNFFPEELARIQRLCQPCFGNYLCRFVTECSPTATPEAVASRLSRMIALGADINGVCQDRCTPLYTAAFMGKQNALQALLQLGANVNKVNRSNQTPLQAACYNCHKVAALMLVDYGATVDAQDERVTTMLQPTKMERILSML